MKRLVYISVIACSLLACQESLEDRCAREVKEDNDKKYPVRVSEDLTIDSVTFDREGHTLHYYYTLSGYVDDIKTVEELDLRNMLRDEVKNSTVIKTYKDNGYNFAYTYYSHKDRGKILFDVTFGEKDYK